MAGVTNAAFEVAGIGCRSCLESVSYRLDDQGRDRQGVAEVCELESKLRDVTDRCERLGPGYRRNDVSEPRQLSARSNAGRVAKQKAATRRNDSGLWSNSDRPQ